MIYMINMGKHIAKVIAAHSTGILPVFNVCMAVISCACDLLLFLFILRVILSADDSLRSSTKVEMVFLQYFDIAILPLKKITELTGEALVSAADFG